MAGFDDLTRKAKDFLASEKAQDAIRSEKAEQVSDKVLDGVAGFANRVTGGKHADKIAGFRDKGDDAIGTEGGADGTKRPDADGEVGPDGTRRSS